MLAIVKYWPMLAVAAVGIAGLGVLVFFVGSRRPFVIAVFLAAGLVLGAMVYILLEESPIAGLLEDRYTEKSLAAFTEVCNRGCAKEGHDAETCQSYCACLIDRGRRELSMDEMLALFGDEASDSVETRWRRVSRTCAIRRFYY